MIEIRRIRIGEADLFRRIRLESIQDAPYAFSSTYESALHRSIESWQEQADSTARGAERATFIAFSDGVPIGIAALYRIDGKLEIGEVIQVWIASDYRGKGIARDLMESIFTWASENGFRTIKATIIKGNIRALRFYSKYGFTSENTTSLESSDDIVLTRQVESELSYPTKSLRPPVP